MNHYDYFHPRSALSITLSVWNALFLREAVARLSAGRIAWLWLLLDPIIQISLMIVMFTVIRMRSVDGMSIEAWLIIGMLAFLFFKRTSGQVQNAIGSNRALFSYRQVKPVDALLVRAYLEGFITTLVTIVLGMGGSFFGISLLPSDPLTTLTVLLGLWLLGLGYGLVTSVATELVPKVSVVLGIVSTFLMLSSGVMLPINNIPDPYRSWLLINPLLHGTEAVRHSISPYYHALSGVDISYIYRCAGIAIFFGLALHRHYQAKLTSK